MKLWTIYDIIDYIGRVRPAYVPILIKHPDTGEYMQFSYCYNVAFEDNTAINVNELDEGENAFTVGVFEDMVDTLYKDQLDDYFVIDLEDDHDPEYDWYYHVVGMESTDLDGHVALVMILGEPEAATDYVERAHFEGERESNYYHPDDYDEIPVAYYGRGKSSSSSSSSAAKKNKNASQIAPAFDVASGKVGLGIKIGGGQHVGLGYNVAAKKGGVQFWGS